MAEQVPYAVAASLISRLGSKTFREFGRIYSVMEEVNWLKKKVESIRVVLLDVEEKQEQSNAVQNWIKRLKDDVLHPAHDLLDKFVIEDLRPKMTVVFHPLSPKKNIFCHKMAFQIEKIKKSFKEVMEEMSMLNFKVVNQTESVTRETGSFVLASGIIGREDSKNEIISLLKKPHNNQNVSSVSIVGIGGLGKTALAQLVYNNDEVESFFEKKMWVCVSDNLDDVKTVVKKMLESLSLNSHKSSLDDLQNTLRENLMGKRYLLVLDDIWNVSHEKWTQLRTLLMIGAQGSKVLVTTRNQSVAHTMGVSIPFVLNGLTLEESWSLLKNVVTSGDDSDSDTTRVNQTLERIGMHIAEKCKGVPLAIRTLGGMLHSKREEQEWMDVLKGDFWKLCEDEDGIIPVLKLSYQNLPSQLRQCFAYCSLYPKGWKIDKDELIQLWMAQGYLECPEDEQRQMEDVGDEFVNTFLMKSFFQDATKNEVGDIVSVKMHDLMHGLATRVAGNDCCCAKRPIIGRPMHVSLERNAIDLLNSLDASRLRTLILWSNNEEEILNEEELSVISKFKHLRVLKLSYCSLEKLSGSIGKMKHLRYLNLSNFMGSTLSNSISNLVCLQTLRLKRGREVGISTEAISKLTYLRHLDMDDWKTSKENIIATAFGKLSLRQSKVNTWISSLTNIVQISLFECQSLQCLPPLENLSHLKSLHIRLLTELEYIYYAKPLLHGEFFPSLKSLSFSCCEKFRGWWRMDDDFNDHSSSSKSQSQSQSQSHHLSFASCLSRIEINRCPMLTHIPTFPNLPKISVLRFSGMETLEATLNIAGSQCSIHFPSYSLSESESFQIGITPKVWMQNLTSLEHLKIEWFSNGDFLNFEIWFNDIDDHLNYLPSLKKITFAYCEDLWTLPDWTYKLSSLQHITFDYCKNFASLHEGMTRFTNLQTLEIIDCPLLFEEWHTEGNAIRPKLAHIPKMICYLR